MAEYIERDKLIKGIQMQIVCLTKEGEECKGEIIRFVSNKVQNPSEDVVEVVRCKDCIYNKIAGCTHSEQYDEQNYNPDYFCADGVREEVEGDNTCVSCGTIIPEGRQVCPKCDEERRGYDYD